jgi:O-antigen ligase
VTWLIVLASGYIAGRADLDYLRGLNLIENGRVQGAVGGMFKNPNDLALNMVAVLPLALLLAIRPLPPLRRAVAALCGVLMVMAIVASQSRSGTLGLAAMALVLCAFLVPRKPGVVAAGALAVLLALPLLPSSYWERVASITNEELDQTGSREARSILLRDAFAAFVAHPITGVGAGQFLNYNPDERQELWRETHNVVLQVAAELGILGLICFAVLLTRAFQAPLQASRSLRALAARGSAGTGPGAPAQVQAEREMLSLYPAAMLAALAGWFVCALFASVAYHWTFYYLLALAAAPRDYLAQRLAADRRAARTAPTGRMASAGAAV